MAAKEDLIFTAAPSSNFQIQQNNDDISSKNKNLFLAIADKITGVCGKIIKPENSIISWFWWGLYRIQDRSEANIKTAQQFKGTESARKRS